MTTLTGPNGIKVVMDEKQIFPNDPGMGTPVLVTFPNGDAGSWNCVTSEGEAHDGTVATAAQLNWLEKITPEVEDWMTQNHV